ncbi:MAG TPA: hypothetical protein VHA82_16725 [Ramlibacter sp.]|uniref:hypothetical protein n=1 Tax=Ramlibacter sp. TaxID=1917967 RepID=UPI002C780D68|nr:hypothetical protein [Ramlibacter sp.]HVZ45458.1 hypothetical protein [Ramlibacter sp.]
MKRWMPVPALIAFLACGFALAKLPAPDDAAKAKAAEAAAKAAWQGKVDAFGLCKAQDRVAAKFGKHDAAAKPSAVSASKPAAAASAAKAGASASAPTPSPAVAAAPTVPACADPGPFAYNPPSQTPVETSGAHSPAGNAASPPSVNKTAGEMKPAEKKK